jgi:Flp pilus assembly protein TadG
LVVPVFFLLVFGLIEITRMMMVQQALTNAAREGCRTAVLATTLHVSKVEAAVRKYLKSVMSNASDEGVVRVTLPNGLASTTTGTDVTVAVEVDYADISWLPVSYLGVNPTIAAKQVGKRE